MVPPQYEDQLTQSLQGTQSKGIRFHSKYVTVDMLMIRSLTLSPKSVRGEAIPWPSSSTDTPLRNAGQSQVRSTSSTPFSFKVVL